VDIMLQLARDEHAVALQTVTEPPPDEEGLIGEDVHEIDRPHRRGPRRKDEGNKE
jgi:hypothetical protein